MHLKDEVGRCRADKLHRRVERDPLEQILSLGICKCLVLLRYVLRVCMQHRSYQFFAKGQRARIAGFTVEVATCIHGERRWTVWVLGLSWLELTWHGVGCHIDHRNQ